MEDPKYCFGEAVFDLTCNMIAWTEENGRKPNDSREMAQACIEWAEAFEKVRLAKPDAAESETYLDDIDEWFEEQVKTWVPASGWMLTSDNPYDQPAKTLLRVMGETVQLTEDYFIERFKPEAEEPGVYYKFRDFGEGNDGMLYAAMKERRLWTCITDDNGEWCVVNGAHVVNKINYILCEVPYGDNEDLIVVGDPSDQPVATE